MKNDKILEKWNKQFSSVDKLKIAEVKDLYKKIDETDNPELKKNYYDKIILGTQYIVYNYLKSTGIHLLSSVEIGAEDIILSTYEAWIENIKNGKLRKAKAFSLVASGHHFDCEVSEKLGINNRFEVPNRTTFYQDRKDFSENALSALKNEQLREAFIKYYRIEQTGAENLLKEQEVLSSYDMSANQKEKIIIMFSKIREYLNSMIGTDKISNTNLKKYIKLVVNNTIAENFSNDLDFIDSREVDSDIIRNDMREKIFNTFQKAHLTKREEFVIRSRFGLNDDCPKTLEEVGRSLDFSRDRVRQLEFKSLRKLRHHSSVKKLKSFL